MVKDKEIYCKNCPHHWKLSDGGKDTYVCHKCGYNNKEMKLTEILKEIISEMGIGNDWGTKNVIDAYNTGDEDMKNKICLAFTKKPINFFIEKYRLKKSDDVWKFIEKSISELEKDDLDDILKELGLYNLEENKEEPNLWANIRAQRARGEKPARKGSKEFKQAVKAAKEINKATKK